MKKLGYTLVVLGLGALILPIWGLQFKIVNALSDSGTSTWGISVLSIVGGIILLFISSVQQQYVSQVHSSEELNFKKTEQTYSPGNQDTSDPDVLLLQSGLTQAVMADIALGIDTKTTISTLVSIGMPETKATDYVNVLLESFMEMSDEKREKTRRNIKQRMEAVDKALSNGLNEETIVQMLMKAEGFTRQQAEGIINYCASVYKIHKS